MIQGMSRPATAILHYSAPPVIGGVEAVIKAQVQTFLEEGFPVTVIAGRGSQEALPPGADLALFPEIDSQNEQILSLNKQLERGNMPSEFEGVTKHLESQLAPVLEQFDVAIIHNIFTKHFNLALTAALDRLIAAGVIKHPIAWCHDISWTSPNSRSKVFPGYPWDLLRTFQPKTTYVAVSRERQVSLAKLLGTPPEEIRVIYNGVEPKPLLGLSIEGAALIDRLGLLESDLNLLMPVRVTRAKNIEYALRVLKALVSQVKNPKMVLTGPPDPHEPESMSYFRSLKDLRLQLDLNEKFYFVFDSGPDPDQPYMIDLRVIGDLYRVSDVMFMPSLREGFGMPVIESGLVGIHAVVTDIPAAREIGQQDVTLISTEDDPEEVADHILAWALGSQIHRFKVRVRQDFTWKAIFRRKVEPLLMSLEG